MYGDYLGEFVCGYWDLKGRAAEVSVLLALFFKKVLVFGGQSNYGLCLSFIFCRTSVTCIFLLHVGKILFLFEVHGC